MPVAGNYFIQTSVDKQVNLVNADGLTLNYWDGDAGPKNNGVIDGGSGTWRVGGAGTSDNWTNTAGTVNAAWSQGAFAVFAGQGGNVKVDSATAIQVQGMQFAANGYTLVNNAGTDALTLTGAVVSGGGPNEADVRVGDGSAGGAGYGQHRRHAGGRARLVKTDLGTLVLSGVNTYAGGTVVKSGTLQVAQNLNLGAASGALSLDGGTLAATASFNTGRAITLGAGSGGINVMGAATDLGVTSAIGGSGALTKLGDGSLTLQADNSYTGAPRSLAASCTWAAAGWIRHRQHPGQRDQQRQSGFQSQQHLYLRRRHQRHGIDQAIWWRHDGIDGRQQLYRRHDDHARHAAAGRGRWRFNGRQHRWRRHQQKCADLQPQQHPYLCRGNQRHRIGHAAGQRHHGAEWRQYLHRRHHHRGGRIATGRGRATGGIVGNVVNNGSLIFNRGNTYTHGGVISGAGNVVQRGAGTTVLGGVNTYTGGTAVNSGTLQISQDANLGNAAGALSLDGARWPPPRVSTRRAPPRWARAAAASMSPRAPASA